MVISWSSYLWYSSLLLLVYYGCIIAIFFKRELKLKLVPGKSTGFKVSADALLFKDTASNAQETKLDAASAAPMHSLVDEIQAYFNQVAVQDITKITLSQSIKAMLQKYPGIQGSVFQHGITNLIGILAEDKCSTHFSADELASLWSE